MPVEILQRPFDPWQRVQEHQAAHLAPGSFGATAVFVGTLRDFNIGDVVRSMTLEHYPGMTDGYLAQIADTAVQRWALLDTLISHRVGDLEPNDPIVLIAVWSAHRKDAFEASRWLMEELKSRAPFWKKERLDAGDERWVEKNTEGY